MRQKVSVEAIQYISYKTQNYNDKLSKANFKGKTFICQAQEGL